MCSPARRNSAAPLHPSRSPPRLDACIAAHAVLGQCARKSARCVQTQHDVVHKAKMQEIDVQHTRASRRTPWRRITHSATRGRPSASRRCESASNACPQYSVRASNFATPDPSTRVPIRQNSVQHVRCWRSARTKGARLRALANLRTEPFLAISTSAPCARCRTARCWTRLRTCGTTAHVRTSRARRGASSTSCSTTLPPSGRASSRTVRTRHDPRC